MIIPPQAGANIPASHEDFTNRYLLCETLADSLLYAIIVIYQYTAFNVATMRFVKQYQSDSTE